MATLVIGVHQASRDFLVDGYPLFATYGSFSRKDDLDLVALHNRMKRELGKTINAVASLAVETGSVRETDDVQHALDVAYMKTQHLEGDWRDQLGFLMVLSKSAGVRSTSVGDILQVLFEDGREELWVVDSVGFRKMD
jgi:hypothetical protein